MNKILWGSSTNAQQFEGGWNEGGKGVSISDTRVLANGYSDFQIASDHYHRMEEDLDLYQEMGFSIYRFSIAWTRIFPTGEEETPNKEGLDFYDQMVDGLIERGIVPVATLYAYDLPQALADKYKGFLDRKVIDLYIKYASTIFEHFKGRIKYYTPFNEPNLFHVDDEYIMGVKGLTDKEKWQAEHHITLAYVQCVNACHEIDPDAKIGPNSATQIIYPDSCKPKTVRKALYEMYLIDWAYLDIYVRGYYPKYFLNYLERIDCMPVFEEGDLELIASVKPDLISTTYYQTQVIKEEDASFELQKEGVLEEAPPEKTVQEALVRYRANNLNPYTSETEWGWIIDPDGFYYQLMEMYHRYQLPILILENGIGATEELDAENKVYDDYRIDYLAKHIETMNQAINDGVEIVGYCTWSAHDLHSTREGFVKRYGFIYVDRYEHTIKSMKRYKKKSFYWYKKVIETNGEDLANNIKY
ncbi:glycoside hydrolase family 1 protein [Listeria monocytogenes]|nr:glycoside hydrolase family 1 protein [Listeria monocytogenes]